MNELPAMTKPVYSGPNRVRGVWDKTTTWKERLADSWVLLPCLLGLGIAGLVTPYLTRFVHWLATKL